MGAIVKVFVVWSVGLAVVLGSSAVSLALPKKLTQGVKYCACDCYSQKSHSPKILFWEKDKDCDKSVGKDCRAWWANQWYSGKITYCQDCIGAADGGCSTTGGLYPPPDQSQVTVAPELAPPPTTIPPRGPRPTPGGIQK